jgi:hypothetical protein
LSTVEKQAIENNCTLVPGKPAIFLYKQFFASTQPQLLLTSIIHVVISILQAVKQQLLSSPDFVGPAP